MEERTTFVCPGCKKEVLFNERCYFENYAFCRKCKAELDIRKEKAICNILNHFVKK